MLDSLLLTHASGVRVLATPARPEQSELLTPEKVAHTIERLSEQYEYVIVDLPHDFSETTLAGLDAAQQILLVLAPEMASVRAMASALETFAQLEYARERVTLVLNNIFERGGLARKEIEAALKQPIALMLPYAPEALVSAINRGVPVVVDGPSRAIGAALEDCGLSVSQEAHRAQRPAKPTEAWQRVAQRSQQRRLRAS